MQFRELLNDDDAVSPVIGVILMVAITVILAAVIGAFVLGFGGGGPSAPTASWDTTEGLDASDNVDNVTFELTNTGDEIESDALSVGGDTTATLPTGLPDELSAGDTIEVDIPSGASEGDSVTIVWSKDGSSSTLATHELSAGGV
ncbi:type IV pilin [Salinarchaeum laminariae]|uniref:type IV pilin n=1 Tax=Salinarchaeum laminariae TaxID=869888 RepID=UPI0020BFF8E4|nr:type IV pilin N-terminal domain-containing protein [Salinarchaeum laminariae]